MIVYSSMLHLLDSDPRPAVRDALKSWLERKLRRKLSDDQMQQGRHDLGHGHRLEVEEFAYDEGTPPTHRRPEHDWATSFRYSHPDRDVHGRRWLTEVGLSLWDGTKSCATVLLQTEEQSALANVPIATTRPRVVHMIQETCRLHGRTPGKTVRKLTIADVDAFLSFARDRDRKHPVLLLSHREDGRPALPPERLAELCLGIADVALIPAGEDTFALERALGQGMCPYRGAVFILWPTAGAGLNSHVQRTRVFAEQIDELLARGMDPASEVLARVCHETNATVSGWHVDLAAVRTLRLRLDLDLARQKLSASASPEQLVLLGMYEQTEKDDKKKIDDLKAEVDLLNSTVRAERASREDAEQESKEARHKANALEQSLREAKRTSASDCCGSEQLRQATLRAVQGQPTLEDSLIVLEHLFGDRLVLLDTAWKSARAADEFREGARALDLLWKLCTGYYDAMRSGGGDKQAIQVFGNNSFAARESETVESNKKARSLRTFTYEGEGLEMMRHLKIGVKESDAATFRAHFHWDSEGKFIVIGHCGGHLDHD